MRDEHEDRADGYRGSQRPRSRLKQLQVAKTIGFTVPPTLISQTSQEIREFRGGSKN